MQEGTLTCNYSLIGERQSTTVCDTKLNEALAAISKEKL